MSASQHDSPAAHMPASRHFGFRFLERGPERASVALPLRAEFLQVEGRVHGGIIAALADTAAVYLLLEGVPRERAMTSVEFKLNFLRPAAIDAGELLARATLVRRGRTIGLADVDVTQADQLVAKGLFTYLFADR